MTGVIFAKGREMELLKTLVVLAGLGLSMFMWGAFFWIVYLAVTGRLPKEQEDKFKDIFRV